MKKMTFLLVFILVFLGIELFKTQAQQSEKKWKLVFEDKFNQSNGSMPDTAKWIYVSRQPYLWSRWIGNSSKTVYIRNGCLVCRAVPNFNSGNDTAKMVTGAISTFGKFSFQYGKVEVKMRTNIMDGNFPAAWLLPVFPGKPYRYGEIDIFESFGSEGVSHQTIHNHLSNVLGVSQPLTVKRKLNVRDWHIYGVEWSPTSITLTIDSENTAVFYKTSSREELASGQWTFDRPYYIVLNQSVGNNSWNTPNTKQIYETQFDWIRVYQTE